MNDEGMAGTTAGSNVANRKQMIQDFCSELDGIDFEIGALRERAKEIKKRVKDDLSMKLSDFTLMRKVKALQEKRREAMFDALREGLAALGVPWPANE